MQILIDAFNGLQEFELIYFALISLTSWDTVLFVSFFVVSSVFALIVTTSSSTVILFSFSICRKLSLFHIHKVN